MTDCVAIISCVDDIEGKPSAPPPIYCAAVLRYLTVNFTAGTDGLCLNQMEPALHRILGHDFALVFTDG